MKLWELLKRETDEDHPISHMDFCRRLDLNAYNTEGVLSAVKGVSIFLTNGKKHKCEFCRHDLVLSETQFVMSQINGTKQIMVSDTILYCPKCKEYFVTQELSRELIRKHPGYCLNLSARKNKRRKTEKTSTESVLKTAFERQKHNDATDKSINKQKAPSAETAVEANEKPNIKVKAQKESAAIAKKELGSGATNNERTSGINAKIQLEATETLVFNTCPFCRGILSKERVNIPVIDFNNNFVRYYIDVVSYCNKCGRAYMSKPQLAKILTRVNKGSNIHYAIRFDNARIQQYTKSLDYLYRPTLCNDDAVFTPYNDSNFEDESYSESIPLNEQSFLGKMGYSVSKDLVSRRRILDAAVHKFGKRRVCDHISFLISTRRAQAGGEKKYANAINIWQKDLNYISSHL